MLTEDAEQIASQQWPPHRPQSPRRPHEFLTKCVSQKGRKVEWPPSQFQDEGLHDHEAFKENISDGQVLPPHSGYMFNQTYQANQYQYEQQFLAFSPSERELTQEDHGTAKQCQSQVERLQFENPQETGEKVGQQSNLCYQPENEVDRSNEQPIYSEENYQAHDTSGPPRIGKPLQWAGSGNRQLPGEHIIEWPPKHASGPNLTTTYPSGFKLREGMPMSQPLSEVVHSQPAFRLTKPMKMRGDSKWPPIKGNEDLTQDEVREFLRPKNQSRDYAEFFAQNALPSNYPTYRAPPGTQHYGVAEQEE